MTRPALKLTSGRKLRTDRIDTFRMIRALKDWKSGDNDVLARVRASTVGMRITAVLVVKAILCRAKGKGAEIVHVYNP
ncbi:MAG: hypothetical protein OXH65_05850 [Paracoccaceae bacterium]|nr:hypothetical protein [Paracoccaceae bacterium]MDE2674616.1 hypothetical protein [Paracoccaceae bacterium]